MARAILPRLFKKPSFKSNAVSLITSYGRSVTVEMLEQAVNSYKDYLQDKANHFLGREDVVRACVSLAGMEVVDNFFFQLKLRMGSQLGLPKAQKRELKSDLNVEMLEQVANYYKEDLQREVNRFLRRKDVVTASASLAGMRVVDNFVYHLKLGMGAQLGLPKAQKRAPKSKQNNTRLLGWKE